MIRQLQYKIEHQHQGMSIGAFLKEKAYSHAVIIELKKDQTGIRKNGVWAGVNERLEIGDVLDICLKEEMSSEHIVPLERPLDILFEDEDLLVVNKPYDMPIHPSINNYGNTLANAVMHYFQERETAHVFRCLNRLDRDTSGVTIIAKNLLSASILSKQLNERKISRIYVAFVEGITEEKGCIDLPIGREENTLIKRKVDLQEGKKAVTHYRRLGLFYVGDESVSIVALKLETGRTHQIRVHMAAIGHPLLGDFLYNANNHMLARQALHAMQCEFEHPITGVPMKVTAPFHKDMEELIKQTHHLADGLRDTEVRLQQIEW